MTKPTTTRALTTMARQTKSGVERARGDGDAGFDRAARRPRGRRERVLASVAAGTGALVEKLVDGAAKVVAALGVGTVRVERRAARREQHAVTGTGGRRRGPHGFVHRRRRRHRSHA